MTKLPSDLLAKIRYLEIHTRRLLSGMQVGDYSTALKGSGLEFDQIRDYQEGDDIRFIDWNSSARMNKLLVRQYLEERNRIVLLVVDISDSTHFGSSDSLKSEVIAHIAGVLALVADYGKDCVGLLLCSDVVEAYIPPKRGRKHVHHIIRTLFEHRPISKRTSLNVALDHLMQHVSQKAMVIVVSDFIDSGYEKLLMTASRRYDLTAIRCLDSLEKQFPSVGFITACDAEGKELLPFLDTRHRLSDYLRERVAEQNLMFVRAGIDLFDCTPQISFMGDLVKFFRRRLMY